MHHKFMVIDRNLVVTGSANATSSGIHGDAGKPSTRGNVNHLLRIRSRSLANLFRAEFLKMWGDGPGGRPNSRFGLGKSAEGVSSVMGDTRVDVLPHRTKHHGDHGLNWLNRLLASATAASTWPSSFQPNSWQMSCRSKASKSPDASGGGPRLASRSFSEVWICWE